MLDSIRRRIQALMLKLERARTRKIRRLIKGKGKRAKS